MKGGYDENIASKGGVKSYTSELLSWCDANILWKHTVFAVFCNPGKFSLCGEVFGWLLAVLVCYRSFLLTPEFSKPGKGVFCKKVTKASYKLALGAGREVFLHCRAVHALLLVGSEF